MGYPRSPRARNAWPNEPAAGWYRSASRNGFPVPQTSASPDFGRVTRRVSPTLPGLPWDPFPTTIPPDRSRELLGLLSSPGPSFGPIDHFPETRRPRLRSEPQRRSGYPKERRLLRHRKDHSATSRSAQSETPSTKDSGNSSSPLSVQPRFDHKR